MKLSVVADLTRRHKQNKMYIGILVTLVTGLVICSGCSSFQWMRKSNTNTADNTAPGQLQVAVDLRMTDIPVPAGFKLDRNNSFAFQNDYTRVGILVYKGRATVSEVIDFYKEQMPLYNWTLVNLVEYSRSLINFEKEKQSCIITCEGSRTAKTILTIATAPKSQKAAK